MIFLVLYGKPTSLCAQTKNVVIFSLRKNVIFYAGVIEKEVVGDGNLSTNVAICRVFPRFFVHKFC